MNRAYMTSSGHTVVTDLQTMTLTIMGPTETMDCISDFELTEAASEVGCQIVWVPLDETSYAIVKA